MLEDPVHATDVLQWFWVSLRRSPPTNRTNVRCGGRSAHDDAPTETCFGWQPSGLLRTTAGAHDLAGRTIGCRAKEKRARSAGHTASMPAPLIEFPADDPDRARRFWHGVLGVTLAPRPAAAGSGWQTDTDDLRLGVHERGRGPGDTASLPYFTVADLAATLERVGELGGSIVHPGDRWAVCRDSEGSPFALAAAPPTGE
jgi:predicted enzyme related to lactoylglutathione lyase